MLKAYKYRLYPTKEQKLYLSKCMGSVRYIYNKSLETIIKHYETTGKTLNYFDLATTLLKSEKKEYDWLREPHSQSLQMSMRNLDNAFQKFFHKKSKFPKFKNKRGIQSIQYPQKIKINFNDSLVIVPKIGEIKAVFHRQFEGKIKTCTISKTPTKKYFISILVDDGKELPKKIKVKAATSVGIDLGIKHFATLSDGTKIDNPKFFDQLKGKLKKEQRKLKNKQKGSNNYNKQQIKIAKIHEKIKNQRADFLHKLSSKIISENQTVIIEDLKVQQLMKINYKDMNRNIADCSWYTFRSMLEYKSEWYTFRSMLEYKSEWYGKNLIVIGQFEASSKTCSCCGHINHDLKLSERNWKCEECGTEHDRDINAAINIKKFGIINYPKTLGPKKPKMGLERSSKLVEISTVKKSMKQEAHGLVL